VSHSPASGSGNLQKCGGCCCSCSADTLDEVVKIFISVKVEVAQCKTIQVKVENKNFCLSKVTK